MMKLKGKNKIKFLLTAGLLSVSLSGCKRDIKGYIDTIKIESPEKVESTKNSAIELDDFKNELQEAFSKSDVTLDETCDEFISSITIDGTNVSIELSDGSQVSGTLYNLTMSDISFENFYIYDSQYIDDIYNVDERYPNYKEHGYDSEIDELFGDYENHKRLELSTHNCSVNNEYRNGSWRDIRWYPNIDYSNCRYLWLEETYLEENQFLSMPNLETLILVEPYMFQLDEEAITIQSDSLRNIIIDGSSELEYIDYLDFTGCPNLEIVSFPTNSQETNLNGLKGLKKLKKVAFGLPGRVNLSEKVLEPFQERLDLVSKPFPSDDRSLAYGVNSFISDLSGINGSEIESLNISFLKRVSSDNLLETVKSLPNLKEIVGFEINNAGMCSDELIEYCEEKGIEHPFTEKSLEIKHKLTEIVSSELTDDMNEEEKVRKLSEYIVEHMKYDFDLIDGSDDSPDRIKKGWGECLYYSVIEGEGVCQGYTMYAQNLFTEAGIASFKVEGLAHTWNLVQLDDGYYFVDLTNVDADPDIEQESIDDYSWDSYYLIPVDEEWPFYTYELPIEAEELYKEAKEKREESKNEENKENEVGKYMIQAKSQNLSKKSYSEVCGMIGKMSALGLVKNVTEKMSRKLQSIDKTESLENRDSVIKVNSLDKVVNTLKRLQKLDILRTKRDIADKERSKNINARELEIEAGNINKETNIR